MQALGMLGNVPLQHLQQRARVGGCGNSGQRRRRRLAAGYCTGLARLLQRSQQVGDGICLADQGDRQPGPERALEAQDQFGTSQAVNAQIPLKSGR